MYEITIGVPDRALGVIYLAQAANVSYALATAETDAVEDGLLGKRGLRAAGTMVSCCRTL
jgi:hypothetical protein